MITLISEVQFTDATEFADFIDRNGGLVFSYEAYKKLFEHYNKYREEVRLNEGDLEDEWREYASMEYVAKEIAEVAECREDERLTYLRENYTIIELDDGSILIRA